jgi:GNAT superfamily N-acetyltransferase
MNDAISVRAFGPEHAVAVRNLFIRVNRLLAPPEMKDAFENYIQRSLVEEIDRISEYYSGKNGGFWVAVDGQGLAGMFGLEPSGELGMELRRMYVDPERRKQGIARKMLAFAENECRRRNRPTMDLSTSELQAAALSLYRSSGYILVREEVAGTASNKTLGGGIRRFHFSKDLLREERGIPAIAIRDPLPADWTEWHRMWSENCAHLGVALSQAHDRELWHRIMDPKHPTGALVCGTPDHDGSLLGLAHYVLHPHTFSLKMVCYLEDLWIEPSVRRGGIGRSLIDALVARGKEQDWRRLYWHTEADNLAARSLYDRIAPATSYVRYDIALP